MNPFYFGTSEKRLFGVYHPPRSRQPSTSGVLLCYPTLHEYISSHRSIRQLAISFSKAGFPALRFDYYATGDSWGDSEEAHLAQWKNDVLTAMHELMDVSAMDKVSLVGLRFGATLAAMAAHEHQGIEKVVLWDPVVRGRQYLQELYCQHTNRLGDKVNVRDSGLISREGLLGYPLNEGMQADFERVDLTALRGSLANTVYLVTSEERSEYDELVDHFRRENCTLVGRCIASQRIWEGSVLNSNQLVPARTLEHIVSSLT